MTISELKRAMEFVKRTVIEAGVIALFENLINVLNQNARMQPGSQPQPITEQKAKLIGAIKGVRPGTLTLNERNLLKPFIDKELMGDEGVEYINRIFSEHNLDPMGAVNAFGAMKKRYDRLVVAATETLKVLEPIDVVTAESDVPDGHAVLQITFKDDASINNVTDWRDYAEQWWKIVRAFGLLTGSAPEQARILSMSQGSIIVEFAALYVLARTVGVAADKILTAIERLMELRKKTREIRHLDLTNKQIERDLDKEAESFRENNVKQIVEQVLAEAPKGKTPDGEVANAIKMSIENLFIFLDRGGTVDCRLKEAEKAAEPAKEVRDVYSRIRKLETQIKEMKLIADSKEDGS